MYMRCLIAAGIAAILPASPAAAQYYDDHRAVERCEDAVASKLERSVRPDRLAFASDARAYRVSRSAHHVRGDGFYEGARGERTEFDYDCRFDERGYVPVVRISPPVDEVASVRPRRPWRARVGDAPLRRLPEREPYPIEPARDSEMAADLPPPPERIEPARDDGDASAAGEAAAEAVAGATEAEAADNALGGAVIAAIGDSRGSSEPDVELDRGKAPYEAGEGVTCYPEQRACYDERGFDPGWSEREFGAASDSEAGEAVE